MRSDRDLAANQAIDAAIVGRRASAAATSAPTSALTSRPAPDDTPPSDENIGDIAASGRIDEVGDGIEQRRGVQATGIDQDEVGFLAHLDRPPADHRHQVHEPHCALPWQAPRRW